MTNALFNSEIKTLKLCCIIFEDKIFKLMKVKGDGSCLYQVVASNIMSCCLGDVWTGKFPPGKKHEIKTATYEVVYFKHCLAYMPNKEFIIFQRKDGRVVSCNSNNRNKQGTSSTWW